MPTPEVVITETVETVTVVDTGTHDHVEIWESPTVHEEILILDNMPNDTATVLRHDLAPQLGGDLDLNGYQVRGEVETNDFVLDGGLMEF